MLISEKTTSKEAYPIFRQLEKITVKKRAIESSKMRKKNVWSLSPPPHLIIKWFKSYLSNRVQRVSYDDVVADALPVGTGISQGSIPEPLLFLIFINDM